MAKARVVYFNGEIIQESHAKVPIRDAGCLLGDAVFDTTRTFGGKIFKLQEHLDRLFNSLSYMRIEPGLSKKMLFTPKWLYCYIYLHHNLSSYVQIC